MTEYTLYILAAFFAVCDALLAGYVAAMFFAGY